MKLKTIYRISLKPCQICGIILIGIAFGALYLYMFLFHGFCKGSCFAEGGILAFIYILNSIGTYLALFKN